MKIINDVPDVIYNAILRDEYLRGDADVSVTQLVDSPKMWHLKNEHYDSIEIKASKLIYALLGKIIHSILENGCSEDDIVEERMFIECDGWTISGQLDRVKTNGMVLQDYKLCSVWEYIHGLRAEKSYQANLYSYMLSETKGIRPNSCEIIQIFRDWQLSKAKTDSSYPQAGFNVEPVKLWNSTQQLNYLKERVKIFQDYDGEPCSKEDRWESDTVYAVKKKGNKTAARGGLCSTMEKALSFGKGLGVQYEIDVRPGQPRRCNDYCEVKNFCDQFKGGYL